MKKMVAPHDSLAGIVLNVELTAMDVDQMTVIKLREALEERSLDTSGLKPVLVARMKDALKELG